MIKDEHKWFEVWYDEGPDLLPTYLLIVIPEPSNPELVRVYDPFEKRFIYSGNYEDTRIWLLEDEYSLITGRMFIEDWFDVTMSRSK
jgi:hypothetical protein